ncbi:short chain amide porin [Nitrospirillum amazonense]|uniref:Short chain amide porin n=1 Tax=Nitrospirillum amazonense TaxID=28077 RepID=A0A560JHM6_9PROT|nr:porin [Nitrospirillum amazonense]TWB70698.1 short chain amide porin [Nitrospirillum amazonense]
MSGIINTTQRRLRLALLATALTLPALAAQAGETISAGGDKSITVGLGVRASFTSVEDGAPDGTSRSADFNLDSVRLYISGQLTPMIKATFNTERDSAGRVEVLDGYAQFEPADGINLWVGRMLPPSDRANLDGPYYLNTWAYPGTVSQYPAKFAGRDDGATVWGKLLDKKLVYSVGAFEGHNRITGASNQSDNLLYAGRVAYNFLDAEPDPGYYTSSTYYGSVDVLTLAFAAQYQQDGVGTLARRGDYTAWNVDGLFEKKLDGIGVVTLEGAYYQYDTGGVADVPSSFGGAGPTDNVGGLTQGKAYLVGGAFLIPAKVGWGQFQPTVRYQHFDADLTGISTSQTDLGVNYIIDGHNARISAEYVITSTTGKSDGNAVVLGVQLQF